MLKVRIGIYSFKLNWPGDNNEVCKHEKRCSSKCALIGVHEVLV